jgi:hypothetical protein
MPQGGGRNAILTADKSTYLGFDPGGDGRFGVALLAENCVKAFTVSTVDDAVKWAVAECASRQPIAAGIDTLLHWATTKSGMRPCDLQLRRKYPPARNSIMAPNSLYGAMAIGGMALALRLREKWPELGLNETHPKVLLHACWNERYDPKTVGEAVQRFAGRVGIECPFQGEHEFDAVLSAWATREGLVDGWTDIVGASAGLLFPAGPVRYLWPEQINIL